MGSLEGPRGASICWGPDCQLQHSLLSVSYCSTSHVFLFQLLCFQVAFLRSFKASQSAGPLGLRAVVLTSRQLSLGMRSAACLGAFISAGTPEHQPGFEVGVMLQNEGYCRWHLIGASCWFSAQGCPASGWQAKLPSVCWHLSPPCAAQSISWESPHEGKAGWPQRGKHLLGSWSPAASFSFGPDQAFNCVVENSQPQKQYRLCIDPAPTSWHSPFTYLHTQG